MEAISEIRNKWIDADILPPTVGEYVYIMPVQYMGVEEIPKHVNRPKFVKVIVKNVFDVWVGSVNGQYYNFCKYITMESFKEISTKLGLKDLSQLYPWG